MDVNGLRERVIQGLECCVRGDCDHCKWQWDEPKTEYWDDGTPTCHRIDLMHKALEVLKTPEPRVMALEEIQAAPDYAVLWEEERIDWSECKIKELREARVETEIAPVEKRGNMLYGSGMNTEIAPQMLETSGEATVRYWTARPTEKQRKETAWETK